MPYDVIAAAASNGKKVEKVCLPDKKVEDQQFCFISGWQHGTKKTLEPISVMVINQICQAMQEYPGKRLLR